MNKDQARSIQLSEAEKIILFNGQTLLTYHFFFDDFDETPVASVEGPGFAGFRFLPTEAGDEAARKRDSRLAGPARMTWETAEAALVRSIVAELKAAGRTYQREVKTCSGGRIDILIAETPPVIIEVKPDGGARSVGCAIGQLFAYAAEYPGARKYIAVPGGSVDACVLPLLSRCGVEIWR